MDIAFGETLLEPGWGSWICDSELRNKKAFLEVQVPLLAGFHLTVSNSSKGTVSVCIIASVA